MYSRKSYEPSHTNYGGSGGYHRSLSSPYHKSPSSTDTVSDSVGKYGRYLRHLSTDSSHQGYTNSSNFPHSSSSTDYYSTDSYLKYGRKSKIQNRSISSSVEDYQVRTDRWHNHKFHSVDERSAANSMDRSHGDRDHYNGTGSDNGRNERFVDRSIGDWRSTGALKGDHSVFDKSTFNYSRSYATQRQPQEATDTYTHYREPGNIDFEKVMSM